MTTNVINPEAWIHEKDPVKRRAARLAETERFFATYPNVPLDDKTSYGDWLLERTSAGLPTDVAPPPGVESEEAWRERMIGAPETLPQTADAQHPPFRGSSRTERLAGLRALQVKGASAGSSSRPAGIIRAAWRFVQQLAR